MRRELGRQMSPHLKGRLRVICCDSKAVLEGTSVVCRMPNRRRPRCGKRIRYRGKAKHQSAQKDKHGTGKESAKGRGKAGGERTRNALRQSIALHKGSARRTNLHGRRSSAVDMSHESPIPWHKYEAESPAVGGATLSNAVRRWPSAGRSKLLGGSRSRNDLAAGRAVARRLEASLIKDWNDAPARRIWMYRGPRSRRRCIWRQRGGSVQAPTSDRLQPPAPDRFAAILCSCRRGKRATPSHT